MFTCTIRHDFQSFSTAEKAHLRPKGHSIFLDLDWFALLAEHVLTPDQELRIYVVTKHGEELPCLVLPCIAQKQRKGPLHWSKLCSLSNFYSMDYGPIVSDQVEDQAYDALFDYIADERPGWAEIDFRMLPTDQEHIRRFIGACERHFGHSQLFFQFDNWVISVKDQTAEEYMAARPSRLKNTYKRRRKKLEKEKGFTIRTYQDPDELDQAIADYFEIYDASWKESEWSRPCMEAFIRLLAERQMLHLGILYIENEPVASFFLFIHADREALIYKLAYKEGFNNYSPGTILTTHMIEQAINDHNITLIDYGVGNEKYKLDWMDTNLKRQGLNAYNHRLFSGKILILLQKIKNMVKKRNP
ncbi:MAG: hypothetical protein CMF31_02930 [Kordiimonas sp.]|nr:hypothetical protein [Kordiimonas sp.]|tara:strand:+ start:2597 stop:3673 length:1077 start_codon:yes stop_codon:yes gene_type:complete